MREKKNKYEEKLVNTMGKIAIGEVSIRQAGRDLKVAESTLRFQLNRLQRSRDEPKPGGHFALPKESELELAECLVIRAKWGYACDSEEVKTLVGEYVKLNKGKDTEIGTHLRKYCKFENPGKDWLTYYMKRYELSFKKPSTLEKARKLAASSPNIIYGYYDLLEKTADNLNIRHRPECFWNLDETSVCLDPSRTKVIAPIGVKAARVTAGSGRDNVTVLAAISAAGAKTPPFILFKGVYALKHWYSPLAYPGTTVYKSENGWINKDIFKKWFDLFCNTVTQRPMILVYDGHTSHISYEIVQKARMENISIIKLPSHTTDRLQPLDVSCFKPLQSKWDKILHTRNIQRRVQKLSQSDVSEVLGEAWDECFTLVNIQSGFRKTGMFPISRSVFPEDAFNPDLLAIYKVHHPERFGPASIPKPATPANTPGPSGLNNSNLVSLQEVLAARPLTMPERNEEQESSCGTIIPETPSPLNSPSFLVHPISLRQQPSSPVSRAPKCRQSDVAINNKEDFIQLMANNFQKHKPTLENPKPKSRRRFGQQAELLTKEDMEKELLEESLAKNKEEKKKDDKKKSLAKKKEEQKKDDKKVSLARKKEEHKKDDKKESLAKKKEEQKKDEKKESLAKKKEEQKEKRTLRKKTIAEMKNILPKGIKIKTENGINKRKRKCRSPSSEYSGDDLNVTQVTFDPQNYRKLKEKLQINEYYAVDYISSYYVGRVEELTKSKVVMNFLTRIRGDAYRWPIRDELEKVNPRYMFAGPIKMKGTVPFKIEGLQEAFKAFKNFKKQENME